jgi:endonuclease V-like protein UPF0215 family
VRQKRPHLLGIDDAPFVKGQSQPVPVVGVLMEGHDLIEGIALSAFPVDGDDATGFLAEWIAGLRWRAAAQAIVLGGITLAGLGVIDLESLAREVKLPVLAVTRHEPADAGLVEALTAAGLTPRIPIVQRSPAAIRAAPGLYVAAAGVPPERAAALIRAALGKSRMPEPLRIAHLVGQALVLGQSRGRV